MKDVFAFARAVERQEEYAYGKNLSFTHAMESFAPESRPLVSFILRWAQKNQYRYGYSGIHRIIMALPVPEISCWI